MGANSSKQTEARWRSLIAAQERSGESVAQFAERRGLNPATLYWWRSRLRSRERAQPEFVPIEIVGAERSMPSTNDGVFELKLAGGRRLRVPPRFDADELARLIVAVERAC
jgi:transposase-like protein